MAITRTEIAVLASTSNLQAYSSGSGDGNANQLIIAYVIVADGSSATPSEITVANDPWGISSWTQLENEVVASGTNRFRIAAFVGTTGGSDPGSDTFDISVAAGSGNQTGCLMFIVGFTDDGGTPTLVQSAFDTGGATTTPTITTMAALGASSWVDGFFSIPRNPPAITLDTGWDLATAGEQSVANPAFGMSPFTSSDVTADASPSGTWSNGNFMGGIAVEIAEAGGAVIERAVAATAASGVAVAATFWSIFTRTVAATAASGAAVSGTFWSIFERAVAASAASATAVGHVKTLFRQVASTAASGTAVAGNAWTTFTRAVAATAASGVSTTGEIIVLIQRAVSATATSSVQVAGFLKILSRQVSSTAASLTAVSGFKTVFRQVAASAASGVSVAGARTLMRAVALAGVTGASVSGLLTHVRAVAASAASGVEVAYIRHLLRSVAASAASGVSVAGSLLRVELKKIRRVQRRNR